MKRNLFYAALGLVFITTSVTLANKQGENSNYLASLDNTEATKIDGEKGEYILIKKYDSYEYRRIGGFKK